MKLIDNRKSRLLIEALTHSNWIEDEWSVKALRKSLVAWEWLNIQKELSVNGILGIHLQLMIGGNLEVECCGEFRDYAVTVGDRLRPDVGKKAIENSMNKWIKKWDLKNTRHYSLVHMKQDFIRKAHVEFEQLHPFVDGNGRIGRLLMFWMEIKAGLDPVPILVENKYEYYKWFSNENI